MENSAADEQSSQPPTKQEQNVSQTAEDPLVAALPPNTDYITYLTLLDYNLTPKNLPTLNRLLGEDDVTLAAEIGWDLLKLVLPMLRVEPTAAQECLDLIARRGNPREVIVRVSEEFERLGRHENEDEAEGDDGLPTFAGEAPRVHLGDMKLAGMPESKSAEKTDVNENVRDDDAFAHQWERKESCIHMYSSISSKYLSSNDPPSSSAQSYLQFSDTLQLFNASSFRSY